MSWQAGVDRRIVVDAADVAEFAGRLRHAAERLGDSGELIRAVDPGRRAFGADAPGALGELGRHLYDRWVAALAAGEGEADRQGERLAETAERLGKLVAGHADTDLARAIAIREVGPADPGGAGVRADEGSA